MLVTFLASLRYQVVETEVNRAGFVYEMLFGVLDDAVGTQGH